jgi:dethiobiotin synthetase
MFVVVTGTDTEVGKTFCGAAFARALVRAGKRVVAIKPVESGCNDARGGPEDGELLARATGQTQPERALTRLEIPVAPPLAAQMEGVELSVAPWLEVIRAAHAGADVVLVEGAGGLLSPLCWDTTIVDLARELDAPALLVAADRLGTLNHTMLTLEVLRARGVDTLGVVLNTTEPADPARAAADASLGTNAQSLRRLRPDLPILEVPHHARWEDAVGALAAAAAWVDPPDDQDAPT